VGLLFAVLVVEIASATRTSLRWADEFRHLGADRAVSPLTILQDLLPLGRGKLGLDMLAANTLAALAYLR